MDKVELKPVTKYTQLRLKHIRMTADVLRVLGLEHLVDDVYEAIAEHRTEVNFDIDKI